MMNGSMELRLSQLRLSLLRLMNTRSSVENGICLHCVYAVTACIRGRKKQ
ncbi:hypothetical protein X777_04773 [Ooceraea biroi]|uniref:Uncharacterized protein n=1 Tax=Ooceraea biroi TaxID=2015173 RepID=A0A026WH07_OOCBI|nr:hypothetical protein X777_04773 [Ooceraea biroi]